MGNGGRRRVKSVGRSCWRREFATLEVRAGRRNGVVMDGAVVVVVGDDWVATVMAMVTDPKCWW